MSISQRPGQHPIAAALTSIRDALNDAADAAVWSMSDDDVLAALDESERLAARLAGLQVRLIGEADARGVASALGAPSTAALLRGRLLLHPGESNALVRLACSPDLAATRDALASGDVSVRHARVVEQTVRSLPAKVRADAEAFLLGEAATFDPGQLGKLGHHIRHVVDSADTERVERAAQRRRELSSFDRGDGAWALRGTLSNEDHARLMAMLDPLAAPRPAADGTPDRRTPAQRRADALMEVVDRVLDDGPLPTSRGARPHLSITAGLDTLLKLPGAPAADTTWGGPISAEALRRFACDAGVSLILLDSHGVPLDVGRERRTVSPGLWAALAVRDRGCVFPTCDRPPEWCQAHHCRHWSDGGETKLTNLTLLCTYHHRVVHHHGWDIAFGADGRPDLIPPKWIDPDQTPRRNPHWHMRP
jgi:hypothetical protein